MTVYGSAINLLYSQQAPQTPKVGDGATILFFSDRTAGTIIEVNKNGRELVIQSDKTRRIDSNGRSDAQQYSYEPDPNGKLWTATRRKDGSYRLAGWSSGGHVTVGIRQEYYDFTY